MTARTILNHSMRIAWKDLMELFRNRLGLVLLIVMPLFMMVMVGFIYPTNGTVSNLPVALVNQDSGFNSSYLPSQTFVGMLQGINNQTGIMDLSTASNLEEVKDMVQRGELEGGILIPSNFTQSLLSGQQGTIIIVTDQSNPQISEPNSLINNVSPSAFKM